VHFGLSTHLFHDRRLAREHLEMVAAHGFTSIELFATRTHFDYHDRAAAERLAEWLAATALTLHSVHAPIVEFYTDGVWGPALSNATTDAVARARALDETAAAIAIARVVPFSHLVVHLGQPDSPQVPAGDNTRDAARRSVEHLHGLASALGVRLALEVIPNRLSSAEALVRLIDDLELGDAGVCLDFGHARLGGDLADTIETVSGHLLTTHVHDNGGRTDDHLVPFDGAIDWAQAVFACQKVGYEGPWMLELANTSTPAEVLARAERACARLRALQDN
jgi:sugar phosphate isomerase/epimerase